jgi:hypothetical protein
MKKFTHTINHLTNKEYEYEGSLEFPDYPVNFSLLSKDYIEDKLIQAFAPFLKLEKPLDKDNHFQEYHVHENQDELIIHFDVKYPIYIKSIYPDKSENTIYIYFEYKSNKHVSIYYFTIRRILETLRFQSQENENADFLKNVLNSMVRFVNSIISDYSRIIMSPRLITDKFLGPVEKLMSENLGVSVLGYNTQNQ